MKQLRDKWQRFRHWLFEPAPLVVNVYTVRRDAFIHIPAAELKGVFRETETSQF